MGDGMRGFGQGRRIERAGGHRWSRLVAAGALVAGLAVVVPGAAGLATTCAGAGPAGAAQVAAAPYCDHPYDVARTQEGTVYRSAVDVDGDLVDLALDVWEPVGDPVDEVRPVLLWMHGGYFAFGSRDDDVEVFEDFASRGFVVVSISYRLRDVPDGSFEIPSPAAVDDALEDAVAAVAWVHDQAAALRIDPTAVIASGYSAGAITALGLAHKVHAVSAPGSATPIAAAVSFSGLDLHDPKPARPDDVPVLLYNSDDDTTVPLGAARAGCDLAVAAGSECDLVLLHGEGHTPGNAEHYQRSVAWLAAHGIEQLAGCDRFDPPPVTSETTTTTSAPPASTTTTAPAVAAGGAAPAVPVPGSARYAG